MIIPPDLLVGACAVAGAAQAIEARDALPALREASLQRQRHVISREKETQEGNEVRVREWERRQRRSRCCLSTQKNTCTRLREPSEAVVVISSSRTAA